MLARHKPITRGGALKPVGKQGRANARANRFLKRECERLGIERCEFGYSDCTGALFLSHAHVAKRRELLAGELETAAAVACFNCHRKLDEGMSHTEMRAAVEEALAKRADRYVESMF
jgi:hypothetical protein